MVRTIDEIKAALNENKINYDSITHDSALFGTTIEDWVYWISLTDDWHEHIRLRNIMSELGYIETDKKITESSDGEWFGAEHRFSLAEGVELFK